MSGMGYNSCKALFVAFDLLAAPVHILLVIEGSPDNLLRLNEQPK